MALLTLVENGSCSVEGLLESADYLSELLAKLEDHEFLEELNLTRDGLKFSRPQLTMSLDQVPPGIQGSVESLRDAVLKAKCQVENSFNKYSDDLAGGLDKDELVDARSECVGRCVRERRECEDFFGRGHHACRSGFSLCLMGCRGGGGGSGYKPDIEVFENHDFSRSLWSAKGPVGTSVNFIGGWQWANDRVSTMVIHNGKWQFFEHDGGGGISFVSGPGRHNLWGHVLDDQITFIKRIK